MNLAVPVSIIAFGSYGGLLVLLSRSEKRDLVRQLFFLYLLDMLLLQAAYLMVSLAQNEQSALFWYTFNIPLSLGQAGIYYLFTRAFLGKKTSRTLLWGSAVIWFIATALCIIFRHLIFSSIYRDPSTGLFVPEIGSLALTLSIPVLVLLGAIIFELFRRYQKSAPLQKIRIQYLLLAIIIIWVGMSANGSSALRPYPIDVTANIISAVLIAFAILRYQLLDINIVIRKGLVYSVSVLIMGLGYFLVIFLITHLFILDQPNSLLLSILAAVIVVGILTPLRDRTQLWLDRALFRAKYDGMAMIQRLGYTTASILNIDKLASTILDDVVKTMHIQWAVLTIKLEKELRPIAIKGLQGEYHCLLYEDHPVLQSINGQPSIITANDMSEMLAKGMLSQQQFNELSQIDIQIVIPLKTREGSLVGTIVLGSKMSQQVYLPDDKMVLAALANHVAVTLDNARLYDTVQRELAERIKAETELEKSVAQLKAKNIELESFTYTVSHDLKAPLLTINGFLHLLQKDVIAGNAERINADISRITEATEKMHQLLTELLELSRIGRMMNASVDVPFNELIKDALDIVHGRIEKHNVTVHTQPNLPIVHGDRQRLTEVLQNLIDNAAKYMGNQANPLIEIGQDGKEEGKSIFFVRDNGMGIASEHYERIFSLFNKLDPTSEGTGIGLALVKRIIEAHEGRIWVESESGNGATFYFTLPRR